MKKLLVTMFVALLVVSCGQDEETAKIVEDDTATSASVSDQSASSGVSCREQKGQRRSQGRTCDRRRMQRRVLSGIAVTLAKIRFFE
ncbi:MAG: hypothetical protein HN494_01790 [Opitutae bacterium]|nr:hypothetical protein [Opitutae bacterium]MBT5909538.1 hypothetical protein [Opitutae bacterium]MBT6850435.1 hypothetical protein [Opitutae bacterium]MBT7742540.1 hypothetical protein [Opitutae bacterium]